MQKLWLGLFMISFGCSSSEGTAGSSGSSGFKGGSEGGSGGAGGTNQEGGTAGKGAGATGGTNSSGTNSGSGGIEGGTGGAAATGGASGKGTGGAGGAGGSSPVNLADVCNSYALSLCTKHYECEPLKFSIYFPSKFDCVSRFAAMCLQAAELPGAEADATSLSICSFGIEQRSCRQVAIREFPASCSALGTRKEGAVCSHDWQCSSGLCSVPPGASCGHCSTAQADGPCYDDHDCQSGYGCLQGQCVKYQPEGAPCAGLPCEPGLGCSGFSIRTCKQPPDLGEACDPEDLAAPSVCDPKDAAYCGVVTNKCLAYKYVKEGASCTVDNYEALVACSGSRCLTGSGSCTAYKADGATCKASSECQPPATCGGGKCALVDPSCQ